MARSRGMSLSLDWANMVTDKQSESKHMPKHLLETIAYDKSTVKFCTGSAFTGKWNTLGMAVDGNYVYPHGCEYEGGFEDGMFHGEGTLTFPMGQKLEGIWDKGRMVSYKFQNVDGLDHEKDWKYCTMPDRRFNVSIREGLQPSDREFMTNQQPERPIEPGCYDTGDGFYNPIRRCVVQARDPQDYEQLESKESIEVERTADEDFWVNAITMVTDERHQWIIDHCRKAWDEPAGYCPDIYEDWITGRKSELEELEKKYTQLSRLSDDDDYEESPSLSPEAKRSYEFSAAGSQLSSKIDLV